MGRSVSKENYISFNLDTDSNFKNLRILSYRNEKLAIKVSESEIVNSIISEVDNLNKSVNLNLIVIKLSQLQYINSELEEYLINLNKKVLIISENMIEFNSKFIYRLIKIDKNFIYYFNNDIQYV